MDLQEFATILVLGFFLPIWVGFGLTDWVMHRRSSIEDTSGLRESALHLLLAMEAACAVLPGLFLQINSLILLVMISAYVAHEFTTNMDVGYATPRRNVVAMEQRVHDYLTAIPLTVLMIVIVTHWAQFLAIFGLGPEEASFALNWKAPPVPAWYIAGFLALSSLNAIAFMEEFVRCWRARQPLDRHQTKK